MIKELGLPAALHEVKVTREMFPDIAKGGMGIPAYAAEPVSFEREGDP